jgi:hypothetical protein
MHSVFATFGCGAGVCCACLCYPDVDDARYRHFASVAASTDYGRRETDGHGMELGESAGE